MYCVYLYVSSVCSIINGVKDMDGFRSEMNITLVAKKTVNSTAQCAGEDEKENAILVSLQSHPID